MVKWLFEIHFECWNANIFIFIEISLRFVAKGSFDNDNESAWVQRMAWHQTGDKPLSEPIVVWFSDIYLCCLAYVSQPKNVPLTEGISWWLTKPINCLNASAFPQGSTSCMIHGYWSLHHTHRPLLNATERYYVWPLTQASWSLVSCG